MTEIKIEAFLKETDLERHYLKNDPENPGDRELTLLFEKAFACTPAGLDRVFWFHLTRAKHDTAFESGILPLNDALPKIWSTILEIFIDTKHETNLLELKDKVVPSFQYNHKVGKPLLAGPYAMLVRETAFHSHEMGNHDYLWLPEIVEDICNGYQEVTGVKFHDKVCSALIPYIVKFWSRKQTGRVCIESAMYYLYAITHGRRLTINANTCFDGMNCTIQRE